MSAAALPLAGCRPQQAAQPPVSEILGDFDWNGIGFGIEMSMELHAVTRAEGRQLGGQCEKTIAKFENAFSLYQEDSELSILNRERILSKPSQLFRELLDRSIALHRRTLGYYHPAVHGAWQWLDQRGSTAGIKDDPEWKELCKASDLKFLQIDPSGPIRLSHPRTLVSMNAIAQGFLADTVAASLRSEGVISAMLHFGESYAIGRHPEGRFWNLAVMGTPVNGETKLVGEVEFSDSGLAVSANDSTRILIDPVARSAVNRARVAAVVSSEGAAIADAYATAFAVAPEAQWPALTRTLNRALGAQVHIWEDNQSKLRRI